MNEEKENKLNKDIVSFTYENQDGDIIDVIGYVDNGEKTIDEKVAILAKKLGKDIRNANK